MKPSLLLALSSALLSSVSAQDLLATRHLPPRVAKYSGVDGSLVDGAFIDVDALVGFGGVSKLLWDVEVAANGELWVSNYSDQVVHRFSADGSAYLGDVGLNGGRIVGFDVDGNDLWAACVGGNATSGAYRYDLTTLGGASYDSSTNIWDTARFGNGVLVARSNGDIDLYDPVAMTMTGFASPGGFCEQISPTSSGGVVVANFGNTGFDVFSATGATIRTYSNLGAGSIRGVAELANGNYVVNGTTGVWLIDGTTNAATQLDSGGGAFIGASGGGFVSSIPCMSNANSTGVVAQLAGSGSNELALNDLTLTASDLPLNAFGFFITSRDNGFVANPGGSQGNLCLGGAIGRYVGVGQIQNSGTTGSIALTLDLTAMPQPSGSVAVVAGEDWIFQAWFRDIGGVPTSNFTNALEVPFN